MATETNRNIVVGSVWRLKGVRHDMHDRLVIGECDDVNGHPAVAMACVCGVVNIATTTCVPREFTRIA